MRPAGHARAQTNVDGPTLLTQSSKSVDNTETANHTSPGQKILAGLRHACCEVGNNVFDSQWIPVARCSVFTAIILSVSITYAEPRVWTSRQGQHKDEAELVKVLDDKLTLRNKNGNIITVPINKLSQADEDCVTKLMNKTKKEAEDIALAKLEALGEGRAIYRQARVTFGECIVFEKPTSWSDEAVRCRFSTHCPVARNIRSFDPVHWRDG